MAKQCKLVLVTSKIFKDSITIASMAGKIPTVVHSQTTDSTKKSSILSIVKSEHVAKVGNKQEWYRSAGQRQGISQT